MFARVLSLVLVAVSLCTPAVARADVVLQWNLTMVMATGGQNPFAQTRFAAITQLAVFEAVNAIEQNYQGYLPAGTVTAPSDASVDAAVASAAHDVLENYLPAQEAFLDAALATSLAGIPDGPAKDAGIAAGQAAAAAMIALRANDGSQAPLFYTAGPVAPGQWQPTPSCAGSQGRGAFLHWRNVTPFGIPSGDAFRLGPPPALLWGAYMTDFDEVKAVGSDDSALRPFDRAAVAQFYAITSPVNWANQVARQVADAQGRSISENARGLALMNMALADGAIAVFDTKYHYNFWRPETAIHAAATDGNDRTAADDSFAPFIGAPCFPSYPSGHATLSYAAKEVLDRLYGASDHNITLTNPNAPGVSLSYTEFKRIVEDIDDARVFGGIHFRFDQDGGGQQGRNLGAYIFKNNLKPIHP
jgi:hypothetical protein